MISVERLIAFHFNAHIALQVDIIQVVASKESWPGDLLPETFLRVWPEYDFPPFQLKSVMRTDKSVSESVR